MKRSQTLFVGLFLVATVLFSVVGHAYGTSFLADSIGVDSDPYDALSSGKMSDLIDLYTVEEPASELIQTTYEKNTFLSALGVSDTGEIFDLSFPPRSLIGINRYYPVECVRQVSDTLIYVVYRLEDSGQEVNAYFFFEKLDPNQTAADEDMEVWWLTGRVLFSCTELSYDDFSSIHIGSPVSAVVKIDPMTKITIPEERGPVTVQNFDFEINDYVEETVMPEPVLEYKEYHLLTDGILCIMYSRDSADQEFVVSSMGFNESFEIASNYAPGTVQLEIASIDYAS